jgi:hypothetical protein
MEHKTHFFRERFANLLMQDKHLSAEGVQLVGHLERYIKGVESPVKPSFNKLACMLVSCLLAVTLLMPVTVMADTKAPYSEPFHKQGRGWYASIYWSTGRNLGSYYFPNTDGALFEQVSEEIWDKEANALVYFYRPDSQWASEELEAPSYYINDEVIFNMRSGSYTYVQLPAGSYDFAVRKSLMPLIGFEAFDDKVMMAFDLNLQANFGLELDAGSITYIRHSEEVFPSIRHSLIEPEDPMATADVQLVEEEMAMKEIPLTRYLNHSFWHPTDAANAEELLSGDMQEYGWFTVIWPWSNNFMFGFPLFYLPSDMYRELRSDEPLTLEQELYLLADDEDAYLEAIEEKRQIRRNWIAPWRKPTNQLTLEEELTLDRLERAVRGDGIVPAPVIEPEDEGSSGEPWYAIFQPDDDWGGQADEPADYDSQERRESAELIKQSLN